MESCLAYPVIIVIVVMTISTLQMYVRRSQAVQAARGCIGLVVPNRLRALEVCDDVLRYFHKISRESVIVLYLDASNACIHVEMRFGSRVSVEFPTDEIASIAVRCGARKIVVAHNHPGENPTPSDQDVRHAASLMSFADTHGIAVVDDLVWCVESAKSVTATRRFKQMLRPY